jgi:hypothetical protein
MLTAGRELLVRTSLRELLAQLDPKQFWQVHRGTAVQARCIATARRDGSGKVHLTLRGRPEALVVSRLYAHRFRGMWRRRTAVPVDPHPGPRHLRFGVEDMSALAKSRGTTVNRLLDEAATLLISEFGAETRFRLRAAIGAGQTGHGLALLDKAQGPEGWPAEVVLHERHDEVDGHPHEPVLVPACSERRNTNVGRQARD